MGNREINPFLFYSNQLQTLLEKASKEENPALWLFNNDARTILFMLESLTRLHKKAFDEKFFVKWNSRFKKLEDIFGQIDNYNTLGKELKLNKKVSAETIKYFSVNANKYILRCNQRLHEKEWLDEKMQKFDDGINQFKVKYNKDYFKEIKFALDEEIDEILDFAHKYDYSFTKLEEQVHEIRRKLRWLSIYAKAMKGLIQLKTSDKKQKYHINYFTKDVLDSSFNKLDPKPEKVNILEFDKNSFLALSWLIEELGKLKDTVLKLHELKDAIYIVEDVTEDKALAKAISILGLKKTTELDILKQASDIIKTALVKDKILDKLIIA